MLPKSMELRFPSGKQLLLGTEQATTYVLVGIIATHAGLSDRVYKAGKDARKAEKPPVNGPVGQTPYLAVHDHLSRSDKDRLTKLHEIRTSIVHGDVSIKTDGSITVTWHNKRKKCWERKTYTQNELACFAEQFFDLSPVHAMPRSSDVLGKCRCGAMFTAQETEYAKRHRDDCPFNNGQGRDYTEGTS